ncbi:MAG: hypothetical protein HC902_05880 [Calothrix sp. SM1_5_4]|nr:hypothetical protein [Calothrix sp. SM1_5_4]
MSSATGGTGVAGVSGTEAAFLNPAMIPVLGMSGFEAFYREAARSTAVSIGDGLGAIDSSPEVWFPGTLHYVRLRERGRGTGTAKGELWHAGVGKRVADQLNLGLSAYRLILEDGAGKSTQWNFSLGALWMITRGFGVGYSVQNLARPGSDVPVALREPTRQILGVLAPLGGAARFRADIARIEKGNPDRKLVYMVGFESKTTDLFMARVGFRRDDLLKRSFWSAGMGFDGPRLKIDYAFEKASEESSGALHSVDLRLPF